MRDAFVLIAAEGGEETHSILIPSWPDIIWGSVAFVAVLVVVIWKVLPNVNKALDARRDAIEGSIERAAKAQAEAEAAKASFTDQLAEARAEAARIREQARTDAQKIAAEVKEQATADAARIVANAQTAIESERAAALASLRAEVGTLALQLAGGVIGETLSEDQRAAAVVDRFLADLKASEGASK